MYLELKPEATDFRMAVETGIGRLLSSFLGTCFLFAEYLTTSIVELPRIWNYLQCTIIRMEGSFENSWLDIV